jgi:hypothetical protein
MGAKIGLSLWRKSTDWGFLRTVCWEGYFDLKGRKTDRGENCVMISFTACILHLMLLRWLNKGGWGRRDMGEGKGVYRVLVGRPEGRRPLGWPRHRWEDNIKMDFRETWIDGANWIRLTQDRVRQGGFCERGNEPSGAINNVGYSLTSWVTINSSKNIMHHWVSKVNIRLHINPWCNFEDKSFRGKTDGQTCLRHNVFILCISCKERIKMWFLK